MHYNLVPNNGLINLFAYVCKGICSWPTLKTENSNKDPR